MGEFVECGDSSPLSEPCGDESPHSSLGWLNDDQGPKKMLPDSASMNKKSWWNNSQALPEKNQYFY